MNPPCSQPRPTAPTPTPPLPKPSSLSLWGRCQELSQLAWVSQELRHHPFSSLHPVSDLTPCMSPWHFGDFEFDACSFPNKIWMEHTGLWVAASTGLGQHRVNPGFWDLRGMSRPLWAMGAGGGQPDPRVGDPRNTQEGTGTAVPLQGSLGGTAWEPGTEPGAAPALPCLCPQPVPLGKQNQN